jgi:adenosylcobinamide-phosphate synthase
VAENTTDGVIAPLLYLALGGPVVGMAFKAVSTMDSMIGYRDERYLRFGTVAARMDDVLNWIPARLTGALLVVGAWLTRLDVRGAWRIWRRDHANHASPNSAHGEAAMAGALGIRLAGSATYRGVAYDKPTIGDDLRVVEAADIGRACRLMLTAAVLGCGVTAAFGLLVWWLLL